MWMGVASFRGRRFDGGEDGEIIFKRADIRHEHAEPPVARLDGERGARDAVLCGLAAAAGSGRGGAPVVSDGLTIG